MISDVSICNRALRYLGAPEILSLEQPSREANLCARHYAETRDELLESHNWNFATRYQRLARIKEEPPFDYAYAYQLPHDCLRVRALRHNEPFAIVANSVLYTNVLPAEAIITVRVKDPAHFSALFVEAFSRRLAGALAVPLLGNARLEQVMLQRFAEALDMACMADASEGLADVAEHSSWLGVR